MSGPLQKKFANHWNRSESLTWSIRPSMISSSPTSPLSLCTSDPLALGTSVILSNFQKLTRPQQRGYMVMHWHGPQSIPAPCASGEQAFWTKGTPSSGLQWLPCPLSCFSSPCELGFLCRTFLESLFSSLFLVMLFLLTTCSDHLIHKLTFSQ